MASGVVEEPRTLPWRHCVGAGPSGPWRDCVGAGAALPLPELTAGIRREQMEFPDVPPP